MKWFKKINYDNIPKLPTIDEISIELPAISQFLEAFMLPEVFKSLETDTVPVIDIKGRIVGIVSEYDLAKILPEWSLEEESYRHNIKVSDIMTTNVWTETRNTNIEKLFSSIHQMHTRVIPIVDRDGTYTEYSITRNALVTYLTRMVKPRSIGGLATPLGVYMTDGMNQAGSKNLGLILTGFALGIMAIVVQAITGFVFNYIKLPYFFILIFQLVLFILILRITPLAKYHAAEHQTIHAIEKGLPLTIETVNRQPRPHKRCGTNIMVLLVGIQLVLLLAVEIARISHFAQFLFLIFGLVFVFSYWRKAGMWIQQYLTTAPANNTQIENGIKTGEELLKMHKEHISPRPPDLIEKIWNMGLIQVLLSFLFIFWISDFILSHL